MTASDSSAGYEPVVVPHEFANDDHAVLVAWSQPEGAHVEAGAKIAELEFSKSLVDLTTPRAGWIFFLHQPGAQIKIGEPVAMIADTAARPAAPTANPTASLEMPEIRMTAKARKLIAQHGLDIKRFGANASIKEDDVLAVLGQTPFSPGPSVATTGVTGRVSVESTEATPTAEGFWLELSPARRRAAQVVSQSKLTIPHSYLSTWLPAERCDAYVRARCEEHHFMMSLSDGLVHGCAQATREYPRVNARWTARGVWQFDDIHLGFALNQANGELIVPVLRHADRLSLEDIVAAVRVTQKKALRHQLKPHDLAGGTLTVTSLVGSGAQQVMPIIVPGQAVIIALGDRCERSPAGNDAAYCLTIAFDHRVLNGAEAAEFLSLIARAMQGEAIR